MVLATSMSVNTAEETPTQRRSREFNERLELYRRDGATPGVSQQVSQIMEPVFNLGSYLQPPTNNLPINNLLPPSNPSPPIDPPPPTDPFLTSNPSHSSHPSPPTRPPAASRNSFSQSCRRITKLIIGVLLLCLVYRAFIHQKSPRNSPITNTSPLEADIRAWTNDLMIQTDSGRITDEEIAQGADDLDTIEKAVCSSDDTIQVQFLGSVDQAQSCLRTADNSLQGLRSSLAQRNESWPREFASFDEDLSRMKAEQKGAGLRNFIMSSTNPSKQESMDLQIQHRTLKYSGYLRSELLSLSTQAGELDKNVMCWTAALTNMTKLIGTVHNSCRTDLMRILSSYKWKLLRLGKKDKQRVIEWMQQIKHMNKPVCKATELADVIQRESADFHAELNNLIGSLDASIRACQFAKGCQELRDDLLPLNRRLAELGVGITYIKPHGLSGVDS
ncbi:MAG: hypothetical protein Q9225_006392 [Loekoesia sp. 1 TL-2023]